jgi:glycosyltransferase involved in cell wall biosynthesis
VKILVAHCFYRLPGGEDRYVEQQMDVLGPRHTVELLARRNEDLGGNLDTARRMLNGKKETRAVEDAIARFQPDVVHLHNSYPSLGPAVPLAAERRGVPLVMTVHNFRLRCPNGYMFTEGSPCYRCEGGPYYNALLHDCFPSKSQAATYAAALWLHRFVFKVQDKVTLFLTPSRYVSERMLSWGFAPERVKVVRNFTDIPPDAKPPGNFGMYVGRLSSEKGLDVMLRALKSAGDPPFRIVGDGIVRAALESLARELGLVNTTFVGRVPPARVGELLEEARYVAMPSLWDEVAGIAALEAMALGRPLLVTEKGGLPELIENGEGLQARAGDATDTAAKVRTLMEDEISWNEMSGRALARARTEFTPEAHAAQLEHAYEEARALFGRKADQSRAGTS